MMSSEDSQARTPSASSKDSLTKTNKEEDDNSWIDSVIDYQNAEHESNNSCSFGSTATQLSLSEPRNSIYSSSDDATSEKTAVEISDDSKPAIVSLKEGKDYAFRGPDEEEDDVTRETRVSQQNEGIDVLRVWEIGTEDSNPPLIETFSPHDPPELFDTPLPSPVDYSFDVKDLHSALEECESLDNLISDIADFKIS